MGRFVCVLVGVALLAGRVDAACVGDCGGDGSVSFAELVQGVSIALGDATAGSCSGLERSDAVVSVDDLVAAVGSAHSGCGASFAGDYAATVTFDASHTGILNLTADAHGEVDGSILITTASRKFHARISFSFPVGGASVALSGSYSADTGGFEVSGSYIDGSGNTVPVVISGNLPGPTGSVPVNVYVGNDPNDVYSTTLTAGMLATPTPVVSPTPGPGGEPRIVFSASRPSTGGLTKAFLLNSDGTGERRLTTSTALPAESNPAWSPDGSMIALSIPEGSGLAIAVANADGSGLHLLTEGGLYFHPAWSPDGTKISFTISTDAIAVINTDGSNRHELVRRISGDEYGKMSWSPDGTKIAFESTRGKSSSHDDDFEIFVMNADGSGIVQLTSNNFADHSPAWKPDGTKIAFHSKRPAPNNIFLMNPDGSGQTQLTHDGILGVTDPAWSQDGTQIAYGGFFGVSIANADGSAARTVAGTMFITDFDLR